MCACEIYEQMTLSEKGGSIVYSQSCKWRHFIHWNLNFYLLSHDLRNFHLLLFWKSFDLSLNTSIREKFKMQIPMRTKKKMYVFKLFFTKCKHTQVYVPRGMLHREKRWIERRSFLLEKRLSYALDIVYELIGVSFPPPRGIFANISHLKEHYIRNILSHVSTLAVGAFRIFGVKREKLCKNHWK